MKGKASLVLFYLALLQSTTKASDLVSDPVGSFRYGDRLIRIWPRANNGPELQASLWGFRYDPVILPATDENNEVILTTKKQGSRWRTDLVLAIDDPAIREMAFRTVQDLYKEVTGLRSERIFALPVKNITIEFPDLVEYFPDVNLTSPTKPCPDKASCFTAPPDKIRVAFYCQSKERAVELEEALRSSQLKYEIESYTRILKNYSSGVDHFPVALDALHGHLDLLSSTAVMPPFYSTTKDGEKRLTTEVENLMKKQDLRFSTMETSFEILKNVVEKRDANVEANFDTFMKNLNLKFSALEASSAKTSGDVTNVESQFELLKKDIIEKVEKRIVNVEAQLVGQKRAFSAALTNLTLKLGFCEKNLSEEFLHKIMSLEANLIGRLEAIDSKVWNRIRDIETKLSATEVASNKSIGLINECESGWRKFCIYGQCHCYKYIEQYLNWASAEENCKKLSSHLVSIHSAEEKDFVLTLVENERKIFFTWIGLNDRQTEGTYLWSDESNVTFINWRENRGQPNRNPLKNCVRMSNASGQYYDTECEKTQPSTCKRRL